ncbi:MAG: glycosyltransferase [Lachnospiraceae bacterium]
MKIGIFTDTYYPEINGVANSAYQLKKELENRGNSVYVFTVSNPEVKEQEPGVFRMKSLPFILLKDRRIGCSLATIWMKTIEALELDIIHTQTEFSIGHLGRKAARELKIPIVHTYHTIYEDYTHYLKVPGNETLKGMIRTFSRYCCNRADTVIVPTKKVEKLLKQYHVSKEIAIQPTGIDIEKFQHVDHHAVEQLKKQWNLSSENHILISIGRISKEKNIEELIYMMKKVVQIDSLARLLIVGAGPEKEKIISLVQAKGLESFIIFAGEVNWNTIQNYYALGDVFVSASKSETQGLTYVEALASGKPLLVRKDECLEELLENGRNGYSYSAQTEFLEYYFKLFYQNIYLSMEKEAVQYASRISANKFGAGIENIYRETIYKVALNEERKEVYDQIHSIAG